MSKAVLISIKPEWCEQIALGKKTIEVRKTYPKLQTPFKCYIYCSIGDRSNAGDDFYVHPAPEYKPVQGNGRVIGEFVCDGIYSVLSYPNIFAGHPLFHKIAVDESCLSQRELEEYSKGKPLCGWHITELVIYDRPKYLKDFIKPCENDLYCEVCAMYHEFSDQCGNAALKIKRPPQSWCYVEEWSGGD